MNQVIANKVLKDSLYKIMINVLVDEAHVKQAHLKVNTIAFVAIAMQVDISSLVLSGKLKEH